MNSDLSKDYTFPDHAVYPGRHVVVCEGWRTVEVTPPDRPMRGFAIGITTGLLLWGIIGWSAYYLWRIL
jgi:hypothetical protein